MSKLEDFAIFILTHGRPDNVKTCRTLQRCGYTGRVYIVIDNEDKTADKYYENFGKENVIMFDKLAISKTFDEFDNFGDRRAIIYARNACFDIAKNLGIAYFMQLDDDYSNFSFTEDENGVFKQREIKNIDSIILSLINYFDVDDRVLSIAFSQRGDFIGGGNNFGYKNGKYPFIKRKCMNSFICSTKRPFKFFGRINEDVNTYTRLGSVGNVFLTIPLISINQATTQESEGGMSDLYKMSGTYVKSFYTLICSPSSVCIRMMGVTHKRLHHFPIWSNAVPCIIDEKYKKK
jgi:hypothetical protein